MRLDRRTVLGLIGGALAGGLAGRGIALGQTLAPPIITVHKSPT